MATPEICFDIFTVTIHRTKKKHMNGDEKHKTLWVLNSFMNKN